MRYWFKYIVKVSGALLIAGLPIFAQAACSDTGYTVVFVNGIFTTKEQAIGDAGQLKIYLGNEFNDQPLGIQLGYNQTHLAGKEDLFESYFPAADQYDLDTILGQLHSEITTRKILIVGHSQGAVYANKIYEYLIAHGEPKESVAVYAVASPDSYVAGGGHYRNFELDKVLNAVSILPGFKLLPYNLTSHDYIYSDGNSTDPNKHSFTGTYLALFSNQIVSDINTELWLLKSEPSTVTDGCFVPPAPDGWHALAQGAYTTADPMAQGMVDGFYVLASVASATGDMASSAYGAVAGLFSHDQTAASSASTDKKEAAATFTLLHALNLSSLSGKDAEELLDDDQGAAAVLATAQKPEPPEAPKNQDTQGEVLGEATDTPIQNPPVPEAPAPQVPQPLIPPPPPVVAPIPGGGASGGPAPAAVAITDTPTSDSTASSTEATSTDTTTDSNEASSTEPTAAELLAANPPVLTFSNWRSPDGDAYCDVINRTFDLSWSAPPGAVRYEVTYLEGGNTFGPLPNTDDTKASYPDLSLSFGLDWAETVTVQVTAYDADGDSVTGSAVANDAVPDKTSPGVISEVPSWYSTDISINTPLSITYSETVDPDSVSTSTIGFSHIFNPEPVTGPLWEPIDFSVSLEGDGKTVDITPAAPLLLGQSYSISASCGVKDLYGNHAGPLIAPTVNPQFMTATST